MEPPRTSPSAASLLLRLPALLRVEELLAGAGLVLFWVLERLRVSVFDLWTQFFREGLRFYLGLAGLVVAVEAVRAGRSLLAARRAAPDTPAVGSASLPRAMANIGLALLRFLRDWAPFVLLLTIYENLIWLVVRLNPRLWDAALQRLDDLLLLGHSTFWLERFVSAGRTEWFSFFYNVLFLYPILIGGLLYLLKRFGAYRRWVLAFSLAGYLGFIGYLAVPVVGPTYYYDKVYRSDLSGRPINRDLDLLDSQRLDDPPDGDAEPMGFYALARRLNQPPRQGTQVPRNCFPSLHTAWGLIILAFCYRHLRPLFWLVLLPVVNLIAATVYLRFHYFVDLLAGGMLVLLTLTLVPRLLRWEGLLRARATAAWQAGAGQGGWRGALARLGAQGPGAAQDAGPGVAAGPSPTTAQPRRRWIPLGLGLGLPASFFSIVGLYLAFADPSAAGADELQRVRAAHRLAAVPPGATAPLHARFGEALVLEAVDLDRSDGLPGDKLRLYMYWRCLRPVHRHWKVFVHVEGNAWRLNRDHHPVSGLLRLGDLQPGEVLRDPLVLHLDPRLGTGPVRVHVGLFDERWVERRMPLRNPGTVPNDGRDRVLVTTLTLASPLSGPRRQVIPPVAGAVVVDGVLDEPGWRGSLATFDFLTPSGAARPPTRPRVWLRQGPEGLYVGLRGPAGASLRGALEISVDGRALAPLSLDGSTTTRGWTVARSAGRLEGLLPAALLGWGPTPPQRPMKMQLLLRGGTTPDAEVEAIWSPGGAGEVTVSGGGPL